MHSTTDPIAITAAEPGDRAAILELLRAAKLPAEDELGTEAFAVARRGARIAGAVALEAYGRSGLLRSLVVEPGSRGQGIADRLVDHLLASAWRRGVETLWLLTTTAAAYFERWGFSAAARAEAPAEIQAHAQFRALCPSTATCMRRHLAAAARAFPLGTLPLEPDVPGARCFAVALESAELTYYEVRPGTRFERHAHGVDQITFVIEGELCFEVDGRPPIHLGPGEVVALPAGVPHAAVAGATPVRAVDAWSRSAQGSRDLQSSGGTARAPVRLERERWFARGFPESLPVTRMPSILERLRGTPARLEEAVRGASREALTRRVDDQRGTWTAQEHVGHLGDLEPLFFDRLDDLEARREALRPADLENRATAEARHDLREIGELLRRMRAARERLVARLETWDAAQLELRALHPRLQQPMSAVDLAHFVAEHDDHHLASIRALLR